MRSYVRFSSLSCFSLASLLATGPIFGQASPRLVILAPVADSSGHSLRRSAPGGAEVPVFRIAERSRLSAGIQHIMVTSFGGEVVRLEHYARNLKPGAAGVGDKARDREPAYLLLSTEDGGFSRRGFWLRTPNGRLELRNADYVDLVVDEQSVRDGSFEEIFAHELGHQILRDLIDTLPTPRSRNMHQSMALTDYSTAFDEGFAEHFQPLTRDLSSNSVLRARASGTSASDLESMWLSRADRELRTHGVKENTFIHRKARLDFFDSTADAYERYLRDQTSTAFVPTQLRTGQEMMASEGVIATLFYRIVNDSTLRTRRREPAFYDRFGAKPSSLTDYENINLKLFAAIENAASQVTGGTPPMIALANSYARLFPDEARAFYTVIVSTTRGATVSQRLALAFERAAVVGGSGDIAEFRRASRSAFALLDSAILAATSGTLALDANVGPQLWLRDSAFKIAPAVWSSARTIAFTLNINTADEAELMTIDGIDWVAAHRIVEHRRQNGPYWSLNDLASLLPADVFARVTMMSDDAKT